MKGGRPLRFMALVLGGWAAARLMVLWPTGTVEFAGSGRAPATPAVVAHASSSNRTAASDASPVQPGIAAATLTGQANRLHAKLAPRAQLQGGQLGPDLAPSATTSAPAVVTTSRPRLQDGRPAGVSTLVSPAAVEPQRRADETQRARLAGDTWLIARPNGGDDLAFGQLGASQAGVRLTYAIDRARSVALSGRLSAPLSGRVREAALGLDWRPTTLPVYLLIEQRVPLDGGPARPAAQLIGSVHRRLPHDLRLEAYAQAGAVLRRGGFADGAVRLATPLLETRAATVDLGAGGWGAAQRDVARLDFGPTLRLALPARGGSVRLGLDYRVRVAGRARPGSGPALTLGSSF